MPRIIKISDKDRANLESKGHYQTVTPKRKEFLEALKAAGSAGMTGDACRAKGGPSCLSWAITKGYATHAGGGVYLRTAKE